MEDSLEKRAMQEPAGWFSEDQLAGIGIQVALSTTTDFMENVSYFVIPEGNEFGDEIIKSVLKRYEKRELDYRLVSYKEPVMSKKEAKPARQAIVFDKKGASIEEKLTVYNAIKNGRQLTVSELATSAIVDAQVRESFEKAEKGPPPTIPLSIEDIQRTTVEIGGTYLVEELRQPIKPEYVSAINRLLAGTGQVGYKINLNDPRQIMFFDESYMSIQSGKEKRELAIKGILDMQLTLEMRIKGESLRDKSIEKNRL